MNWARRKCQGIFYDDTKSKSKNDQLCVEVKCYAECHNAYYAEWHYTEWHYTEWHHTGYGCAE